MNKSVFREYDIRGIVETDLTEWFSFSLGRAFGQYVREQIPGPVSLSVARDVRPSSECLAQSLIEGLTSIGIDIYDLGVCPTPLQYFSLFTLNVKGGIMITGSHNPPEYNGFKLSIGQETLHGEAIQDIRKIMISRNNHVPNNSRKGAVINVDIVSSYRKYMLERFSRLSDRKYRRLKIVVDAGNGTAGTIVPELLEYTGCEVIPLYCEPDGSFPNHHPDPTVVENMKDLINTTVSTGSDIGVGYDGDGDRIGVVDPSGDIVWGDRLMIILSRDILRKTPGAAIIGDVKCSQVMFEDIRSNNGRPVMCRTGHSLIKEAMKKEKALLAGEFSGHIFIADDYFGYDDAIYTTLRLVEIMKRTGRDIKELLSDVPRMHCTPEIRIECPDNRKREVVRKIIDRLTEYEMNSNGRYKIRNISTIDGVRVNFENGWGLIRSSNTQPVIVMRVEATDEKSLRNYREFFTEELERAGLR